MDKITAMFILAVIELIMKYGVPATLAILAAWGVENPTLEDIQALKERVPPPGTYFEEKPS